MAVISYFSLQFPLSWVHLILHWILSPSSNWCLRKNHPSSGREWLSVWQFCLLSFLNVALCFVGLVASSPSVCNIINKRQTNPTKPIRNNVQVSCKSGWCYHKMFIKRGNPSFCVCHWIKIWLKSCFWKTLEKKLCSKRVVECDHKLLSLLFLIPLQSSEGNVHRTTLPPLGKRFGNWEPGGTKAINWFLR